MKPRSLLIHLSVPVLLMGIFACKRQPDPMPAACRLISVTDQILDGNGRLTDEMQRTFTYDKTLLTSVAERSTNQESVFSVERADQRVVRATGVPATSGTMAVTFGYPSATTPPNSATFSRGGSVASTFALEYNPAGRMSRIVENRAVLPANSRTIERAYTFTYDNAGNLITERVRSTLVGGAVVEQETEYTVATKPSPYVHFSERTLLTVLALSQAVETRPGRFWHLNAPTAHKSYFLTSSGSRGNLSESSTFVATYDADSKLMSQEQNALLYQLSVPDPITKKNRQAFVYQCD
ncbi:hypothetical protein [Spirosoma arcticum]